MSLSSGAEGPSEVAPDVPFSLGGTLTGTPTSAAPQPVADIGARLVSALLVDAPTEWHAMAATFSLTVDRANALVVFATPTGNFQTLASPEAFALVRAQRERDVAAGSGLWWRMIVAVQPDGVPVTEFDYGDYPFASEFLFAPEDYRADIAAHPGCTIPVWLAAYAFHRGRQHRPPHAAVHQAAARVAAVDDQWPDLDVLWARWSAVSAAVAATGRGVGTSIGPSLGIFESPAGSGSTLVRLPGGRAVLSGGVVDAPELRAAYLDGGELPDLYAGAPIWVGDSTVNIRLESGMLSFCWWYDDGHWYRAQSPDAASCVSAMPAVFGTDAVAAIARMLREHPSDDTWQLAEAFVGAVESNTVTRTLVETVVPRVQGHDTDAALVSLSVAGHYADPVAGQ